VLTVAHGRGDGPRCGRLRRGACLRILSKAIHFARVPGWAVDGTHQSPRCYPQPRPGLARRTCTGRVHTQTPIVDKPVETVDSHRQLWVLRTHRGRGPATAVLRTGEP
jgi:hypothetical protein